MEKRYATVKICMPVPHERPSIFKTLKILFASCRLVSLSGLLVKLMNFDGSLFLLDGELFVFYLLFEERKDTRTH